MKKINLKRVASVAIALALMLGLFVVSEINVQAEEDKPTGLKEPVVEVKDVSEEEFNEIVDESQKADVETFVEKCNKGTDSFWYQFSSPYYNYSFSRLNANQRKLYDDLYSKLMAYVDCGADFTYGSAEGVYLTPTVKYTGLTQKVENPLLFCKNKWLLAHEDNKALIERGVSAGITGENFEIKY